MMATVTSSRPPIRRGARRRYRRRARRGAILVTAMWVLILLTAIVLVMARSMRVEAVASGNRLAAAEADTVEKGAEQYVLSQADGSNGDALTVTAAPAEAMQVGGLNGERPGYFWILRPDPDNDKLQAFGITDESSKVNLNATTSNSQLLLLLPNVTEDVADAIVDWRDTDDTPGSNGAESDFYGSASDPYQAKNADFETVEELLLVRNVTPQVLFGYDTNRNGVIDGAEQANAGGMAGALTSAFNSAGSDSRGLFNFVTAYSVQPSSGRVSIGQGASADAIRTGLQKAFSNDSSTLNKIMQAFAGGRGRTQTYTSLSDFFSNPSIKNLTAQQKGKLAGIVTAQPSTVKTFKGLINLNTAPRQVLQALPGLEQGDADTIISARQSAVSSAGSNSGGFGATDGTGTNNSSSSTTTSASSDLTWLFNALPDKAPRILDLVTTVSYQYSADIVAVSPDGRAFKRVRIVVDAQQSPAKIVYRRDLTNLGWPLDPAIRDDLRNGRYQPPVVSTGVPQGSTSGGLGSNP